MKIGSSSAGKIKPARPQFEVRAVVRDGVTYYLIYHKGTNNLRKPVKEYTDKSIADSDCYKFNHELTI
ncbi:hypothetical protein ABRQ01_07860 [Pectobacterium aroidearum]|uniref:hypothetical protein n=1 Tax=Pectobacterium aroidearum TaxID=1201031 RepID=UPI0032EFEEA2